MKELVKGIFHVAAMPAADGFTLNSYLYEGENWSLLVDPPPFSEPLAKELDPWRVEYILCTSKATFPDALRWRSTLPGAKIVLHIWDADELGNRKGSEVDRPYLYDFYMKEAVRVIHAPGATPGSSLAVVLTEPRVLLAGDFFFSEDGVVRPAPWFDAEMGRMSVEKFAEQAWSVGLVLTRRVKGEPLAQLGPLMELLVGPQK